MKEKSKESGTSDMMMAELSDELLDDVVGGLDLSFFNNLKPNDGGGLISSGIEVLKDGIGNLFGNDATVNTVNVVKTVNNTKTVSLK